MNLPRLIFYPKELFWPLVSALDLTKVTLTTESDTNDRLPSMYLNRFECSVINIRDD